MDSDSDSSDDTFRESRSTRSLTAEQKADRAIQKGNFQDPSFDWRPVLTAFFEREPLTVAAATKTSQDAQATTSDPDGDEVIGMKPPPQHVSIHTSGDNNGDGGDGGGAFIPRPPPKGEDGSWDYVLYVPEWSHPDFDPRFEIEPYTFRRRTRPTRDVLRMMRPALRAADAVRNPTPYALRWGINPDRTDGRSRLSPSWSTTRDLAGIMQTQMDNLSDEERRVLLEMTNQMVDAGQIRYPGQDLIAPEALEAWKRSNGIPSFDDILNTARFSNIPFEKFTETLTDGIVSPYQGLIDLIQDDEDFQRLVFREMTTDEIIRGNIHTMSDAETCDLRNEPLHP
jgi:hypothetical protein